MDKKHRKSKKVRKTVQKSLRLPAAVLPALDRIAAKLNKSRDPIDGLIDPTKLINRAIRDLLIAHGECDAYPAPTARKG